MLQEIDGKMIEVVEFDTLPELPITGLTQEEAMYMNMHIGAAGGLDRVYSTLGGGPRIRFTYAQALTHAIEYGVITEPGKYGIHLDRATKSYDIFKIVEP